MKKQALMVTVLVMLSLLIAVPVFASEQQNSDFTPPKVVFTLPSDNTSLVPTDANIQIWFSEEVNITDIYYLEGVELKDKSGNHVPFDIDWNDNRMILTPFENLAPLSEYNVQILKGTLIDNSGNSLEQYSFSFKTGNDYIAPKVRQIYPQTENGIECVRGEELVIQLSEKVLPNLTNGHPDIVIQDENGKVIPCKAEVSDNQINVLPEPEAVKEGVTYDLIVPYGFVVDSSGNKSRNYQDSFTITKDVTAPSLSFQCTPDGNVYISASDESGIKKISYSLNDGEIVTAESQWANVEISTSGTTKLVITAEDLNGNQAQITVTIPATNFKKIN